MCQWGWQDPICPEIPFVCLCTHSSFYSFDCSLLITRGFTMLFPACRGASLGWLFLCSLPTPHNKWFFSVWHLSLFAIVHSNCGTRGRLFKMYLLISVRRAEALCHKPHRQNWERCCATSREELFSFLKRILGPPELFSHPWSSFLFCASPFALSFT